MFVFAGSIEVAQMESNNHAFVNKIMNIRFS